MKRASSVILLISVLLTVALCLPISATEDGAQTESEENIVQSDVLSFSCTYDDISKKVTVNGTINHDAFASHKESTLLIFLVPPGMSEYDVALADGAEPLAQTGASVNFGFSFKANGFADRFSRYAIFLKSPDGELTLGTQAQYAEAKEAGQIVDDVEPVHVIRHVDAQLAVFLSGPGVIIAIHVVSGNGSGILADHKLRGVVHLT